MTMRVLFFPRQDVLDCEDIVGIDAHDLKWTVPLDLWFATALSRTTQYEVTRSEVDQSHTSSLLKYDT